MRLNAIYVDFGFIEHVPKMTKKQLAVKSNPLYYFFCENCSQVFPFMQINDDDLTYICFKDAIMKMFSTFINNLMTQVFIVLIQNLMIYILILIEYILKG